MYGGYEVNRKTRYGRSAQRPPAPRRLGAQPGFGTI